MKKARDYLMKVSNWLGRVSIEIVSIVGSLLLLFFVFAVVTPASSSVETKSALSANRDYRLLQPTAAVETYRVQVDAGYKSSNMPMITESRFRFAPGIDDFDAVKWFETYNASVMACTTELGGVPLSLPEGIQMAAEQSGVDPRVLISLAEIEFGILTQVTDDCQQFQGVGETILFRASRMMREFALFSQEELLKQAVQVTVYAEQLWTHELLNGPTFAIVDEVARIARDAHLAPSTLHDRFFDTYKTNFGEPHTLDPTLTVALNNLTWVDFLLPFSGDGHFTGGPHSTDSTDPCYNALLTEVSGIDLVGVNSDVLAIAPGTVVGRKDDGNFPGGKWVAIQHENGIVSMYWHMSEIYDSVQEGKEVPIGGYLGEYGNTGCSPPCSNHIHLELRIGGYNYNDFNGIGDPVSWNFKFIDGWLLYAEEVLNDSSRAENYNGSALRWEELEDTGWEKSPITTDNCGSVNAWVESDFPYTYEESTEFTKFAFATSGDETEFTSSNGGLCWGLAHNRGIDGLCDGYDPTPTPPAPTPTPVPDELVTNVVGHSGNSYELAECWEQETYYTDRDFIIEWFTEPSYNGLQCIKTPNDDKDRDDDNLLEFDLNQPARIYIYVDQRTDEEAGWMSIYPKNGKRVYVSDTDMEFFEVRSCDSVPGHIVLGGPRQGGGAGNDSMYVVAFHPISEGNRLCSADGPPAPPELDLPPDGTGFDSCTSIKLEWLHSPGADDYDVEYWGVSSGSNNTTDDDWTIGVVPAGTYYWHVRANNDAGSSDWSETWAFSVSINAAPSAPLLQAPPHNGWANNHSVTLQWSAVNDDGCPNNLLYLIEVNGVPTGATGNTLYTVDLPDNIDYEWRVQAYDGQLYGPWSEMWVIRVDAVQPDTVVISGPQGDIPTSSATFTWTGSDNRTGVTQLQYAYRLTGPGQPGDWSNYTGGTSTSFNNLSDGAFVFEVRARDLAGNVDGTPDTRSFYVDTTPPETTILSGPNNPTGDTAPIFVWTGSDAHTPPAQLEYSSRLTNTTGFDTGWSMWNLDTMREFIGLTDGLYTFRVYARDGVGNEDASLANWDFHLDIAPPTGTLLINNGASQTTSVVVLLDITGDDGPEGTGVSEMRLSSDGIHWDPWQPFMEFTTWQLPDVNRATWTVYLELKDFVGNVSSVITDDIYLNFYPDRPVSENFQLGARGYLPGGSGSISGIYSLPGSAIGETIAGSGSTSNFYQMAGGYVPGALAQPNGPYPYEVFDMWQQALSAMGGSGSAASYQLFSTGGEGAVGGHTSVSANYSLRSGFWLGAISSPAPIFYDDTDYGVQYDGWRGGLDATAYGGGYRVASVNSQRIIYKSQQPATSVIVVVCRGPNLGYAYILIPGQYQNPIDLYAPQAACDQAVIISELAPLAHTIVFMATGQKNPASSGTEVRLDAFEVNGTRIDDNDPKVIYHSWSAVAAPWALGGSTRLTTQPQAKITFSFEGDAFTWKTITCPGCGRAAVIVDGMPAVTVDNYGSWNLNAEQSFTNLGSGTHTVQIYTLPTPNPGSSGTLITFDGYSVP